MKTFLCGLFICFIVYVFIQGWVLIFQEQKDCSKRGGVMVKGMITYVCVPAK